MRHHDRGLVPALLGGLFGVAIHHHFGQLRLRQDLARISDQLHDEGQSLSELKTALDQHALETDTNRVQDRKKVLSGVGSRVRKGLQTDHRRFADLVSEESARLRENLRDDLALLHQASQTRSAELLADAVQDTTTQIQALHTLFSRHRPSAAVRRSEGVGSTPRQTLDLLEVMHRVGAERTLGFALGESSIWVGYEAAAASARLTLVVSEVTAQEDTISQLSDHSLTDAVDVLLAPFQPVAIPGAVQSWYDVATLPPEARGYDAVLIGVRDPQDLRALLPLISLLEPRLGPGAVLALATGLGEDAQRLIGAWEAEHYVQLDPHLSSSEVTVVRCP